MTRLAGGRVIHGTSVDSRRFIHIALAAPVAALLIFWNIAGLVHTLGMLPHAGQVSDPYYWRQVDLADPYAWEWVRWSPPAVWVWHHAMAFLPLVMVASFASLLLLPRPWALVALVSWPFWEGLLGGSIIVFIVVAGYHALRGSRLGIVVVVGIFALVPRPLMLPLLGVLVWRYPFARWALGVSVASVLAVSLGMGQLTDWLGSLRSSVTADTVNLSPTALVGWWWYVVGLPLAGWLTWKGWVGAAGLAISPYLLMSYLLLLAIPRLSAADRESRS